MILVVKDCFAISHCIAMGIDFADPAKSMSKAEIIRRRKEGQRQHLEWLWQEIANDFMPHETRR
jgi:hypothetical protein